MNPIKHSLLVKSEKAPIVEFDPTCGAVYVRFSNKAVQKTVERGTDPMIVTVDLDRGGDVVGIEAIGFTEFSLGQILRAANVRADRVDLSKARFRGTPRQKEHEPEMAA
ncbi:MAG TPA: DUF2283 domain-containing protein [Chthoniobacteraceae bacterium]|nr:DUF2283 domain-containing protein [Chthoniobacteraceae bacterium]